MSGGSNSGAWEIGVLWGLAHYGNEEDFYWDVVSGVSAGAINAFATAAYAPEDVKEMTEWASDLWLNLHTHDVWVARDPLIPSLWDNISLLDSSPLFDYMKNIGEGFPEGFKRRVVVAADNVNTGAYTEFNSLNVPYEEFYNVAGASGSIPVVFPPHEYRGSYYMDGGTVQNANLGSAVNHCLDFVDDYSDIIVDIVLCTDPREKPETVSENAWHNWKRSRHQGSYWKDYNHIAEQKRAFPDVNYRYYFAEHGTGCVGFSQLNFDGDVTWCY